MTIYRERANAWVYMEDGEEMAELQCYDGEYWLEIFGGMCGPVSGKAQATRLVKEHYARLRASV